MATRFKITFANTSFQPWSLFEWSPSKRWLLGPHGWWFKLQGYDTRGDAEAAMKAIVDGEAQREPAYYDERGRPDIF